MGAIGAAARSIASAESEYIATASCAQEVMFFRQLASSVGIRLDGPTTVFSDSQSALAMVSNPTNARSKHIDIKYHYVRSTTESGNVVFKYVPTAAPFATTMPSHCRGEP